MLTLSMLRTLEVMENEMARAGRTDEVDALRAAIHALARPERGFLPSGQAAERLGVSIPTVKRWVERGTLAGGAVSGRWLVAVESVDHVCRLRAALDDLDREGDPTVDEVRELYRRSRLSSGDAPHTTRGD
jgi:excisionase family DNA binding protein